LALHRVRTWEEYRNLALTLKPSTIFYARDPHPLRKPPWGLKLIFYQGFDGYVFKDYADGSTLHKTKIPIRGQNEREIPLLVEDIERFLYSQIGQVKVSPTWFVS
jgi:hypothetical protein